MDKLPLHVLIEALNEAKRLNLSQDFIDLIQKAIKQKTMQSAM